MKAYKERPRASELGAVLMAARAALERASAYGPAEREEWQAAFQQDAQAAQQEGRIHHLGMPHGPAARAHEARWDLYRAELRATVQALEFALGQRADFTIKERP